MFFYIFIYLKLYVLDYQANQHTSTY